MDVYNKYKKIIENKENFSNVKYSDKKFLEKENITLNLNFEKYLDINFNNFSPQNYPKLPLEIEYLHLSLTKLPKQFINIINDIKIHNLRIVLWKNYSKFSDKKILQYDIPNILPEYIKKLHILSDTFITGYSNKSGNRSVKKLNEKIMKMSNLEELYLYHVYTNNNHIINFQNNIKLKKLTMKLPLINTYTNIILPNNLEHLYLDNFLTEKCIDINLPDSLIYFYYKGSHNNIIIPNINKLTYLHLQSNVSLTLINPLNLLNLKMLITTGCGILTYYKFINLNGLKVFEIIDYVNENNVNDILKYFTSNNRLKYLGLPYYISKKLLHLNNFKLNKLDIPKYDFYIKYPKLKNQFIFLSYNMNLIFNKIYNTNFHVDVMYSMNRQKFAPTIDYILKSIPPLDFDLVLYRCMDVEFEELDTKTEYKYVSTTLNKYKALAWIYVIEENGDMEKMNEIANDIKSNKINKTDLMKYLYKIIVPKGSKILPLIQFEERYDLEEVIIPTITYNKCKQSSTKSITCNI